MSTAKDILGAHLRYFGIKIKKYEEQGVNAQEAHLKAADDANELHPLTEVEIKLLLLLSNMSERQKTAYTNPCRMPFELLSRRYHQDLYDGQRIISSSVTVMMLKWPPVWHVSVALLGATMQPQPLKRMPARHIKAARGVLEKLLEGVGKDPGEFIETATSLQLQKAMSDEELDGLKERPNKTTSATAY